MTKVATKSEALPLSREDKVNLYEEDISRLITQGRLFRAFQIEWRRGRLMSFYPSKFPPARVLGLAAATHLTASTEAANRSSKNPWYRGPRFWRLVSLACLKRSHRLCRRLMEFSPQGLAGLSEGELRLLARVGERSRDDRMKELALTGLRQRERSRG